MFNRVGGSLYISVSRRAGKVGKNDVPAMSKASSRKSGDLLWSILRASIMCSLDNPRKVLFSQSAGVMGRMRGSML